MKIYVLVGHIASGKSTYCKNAAKHGAIIVNDDDIVNSVHGGNYSLYNENCKIFYKSIENQIVSGALAMKRPVVIDRGLNISLQGRKRWLAFASSFDVACEAIVFPYDGPEAHAKRRASHDARGHDCDYWLRVANCHAEVSSTPTIEEGFTAIHNISFKEIIDGKVFNVG